MSVRPSTPLSRTGVAVAGALLVSSLVTAAPADAAPRSAPTVPTSGRPVSAQASSDPLFPTVGNPGYNVTTYAIRLNYAEAGSISARTTIAAVADRRLTRFSLDLEGLDVSKVIVDGRAASFTRPADTTKLVVTPARAVSGRFSTTVHYSGTPVTHIDPDGAQDGWIPTAHGATVLSEPVGAMTWFPNNNVPRDKAKFSISVTVPHTLEVAGSGDLASNKRHGATRTWIWRQSEPVATYLAMISIGQYDVYRSSMRSTTGKRLPIWTFIEPKYGKLTTYRKLIPRSIRFGEKRFGAYPFDSAGIVVADLDVGYALETQNRPVFDGKPDTSTVIHEFAHQWYGNSVTPKYWSDIWLNEGFADYSEHWWAAAQGDESRPAYFDRVMKANPETSTLWSPAPADLGDPANLFSEPVYVRGGLTLEALRQTIGNRDFETIMRGWATRYRGRSVTTAQFQGYAEQVSGEDLDGFFTDWLYTAAKPPTP